MQGCALVTGASGAVGGVLSARLVERGCRVRALVRDPAAVGALPRAVQVVEGNIADERAVRAATAGVDYVFHLAAKLHVNQPAPELRDEYARINVEGTRRVVEAAREADVRRFVFFSTINVYGASRDEEIFDESSPLRPGSWYAETKLEGERIALQNLPDRAVVLRLAAVYGQRMKGNYARLAEALRHGRFVMIGNGRNRRTLIHVEDACAAAILAAGDPRAAGKIYNVTDGEVHTLDGIIRAICAALGRRPPRLAMSQGAARRAARVADAILRAARGRPPALSQTLDKFTEDIAVSGALVQRELGFRPRYDLLGGWCEAIGQAAREED
ncbi:MAG: NAD-dependent epimerase/dehydratase family protein [Acidobacteriota bacterium]|nr:NAD-dependent epimerase/dehydratase family protein [Acidobacteriota bacterium]